jgi:hypothetical protein
MLSDILLRGSEKFSQLILIEPNTAVFGIQDNGTFAVGGVVDD